MDEWTVGEWHAQMEPNNPDAFIILDRENRRIATVYGDGEQLLRRTMLIAAAPALRDALRTSGQVFKMMVEGASSATVESCAGAASEMLPLIESVLAVIFEEIGDIETTVAEQEHTRSEGPQPPDREA